LAEVLETLLAVTIGLESAFFLDLPLPLGLLTSPPLVPLSPLAAFSSGLRV